MTLNCEQRKLAPTRVLVAGGDPGTRRALVDLLSARPGIALLGDTSSHQEAVSAAAEVQPDVILMDVRLPDVTAVLTCRTIRNNVPSCQILLLSTSADYRTVLAAVLSGASGHVTKSLNLDRLQQAIEAVGRGQMRLNPRIAEGVVEWFCGGTTRAGDRGTPVFLEETDRLLLADVASGGLHSEHALATGRSSSDIQGDVARLYETLHHHRGFAAPGNALARLLMTPERD
jgi:DNA-binding NarL/FixJ family response regulator